MATRNNIPFDNWIYKDKFIQLVQQHEKSCKKIVVEDTENNNNKGHFD